MPAAIWFRRIRTQITFTVIADVETESPTYNWLNDNNYRRFKNLRDCIQRPVRRARPLYRTTEYRGDHFD